jgi:hypothetical protein
MRMLCMFTMLLGALMVGAAPADETKTPTAVAQAAPAVSAEKAGVMKSIDAGDDTDEGGTSDERSGVNEGRVLPTEETYDSNTGLSDNVPSDAVGNL